MITRVAVNAIIVTLAVGGLATTALGRTLQVSPTSEITRVGDAVVAAAPGDTVRVARGHYNEPGFTIDKPLTLIGEPGALIESADGGQLITVTADDVWIEGLTLRGVDLSYVEDRAGIKIIESSRCTIIGNQLEDTFFAIYLENVDYCVVRDNVITAHAVRETTSGNGIHAWHCRNVTIEDNRITGHRDGIYLEFVEQSAARGNHSEANVRYGLHFMFSHDDAYEDNTFVRNGAGVAVMFSDRVRMSGNYFAHNWGSASFGLLLKDIRDSDISNNTFERNTVGIYAEGSLRINIYGNSFVSNGYAVRILGSAYENEITGNDFVGNTFDVATNSRQNFNTFDGNYWSNYRGYDLDRDGEGDVPYRPVHLFSLMVERDPAGLVLLRSFFIDLIDAAERVVPIYTPESLMDHRPSIRPLTKGARR